MFTSTFIRPRLRPASLAETFLPVASLRSPQSRCRPREERKEQAGGASQAGLPAAVGVLLGGGGQRNKSQGRKWRAFRTSKSLDSGSVFDKGEEPKGGGGWGIRKKTVP
jgi:hypothetical protein